MKGFTWIKTSKSLSKIFNNSFTVCFFLGVNIFCATTAHHDNASSRIRFRTQLLHKLIRNVDRAIEQHVSEFVDLFNFSTNRC